MAARLPAPSNSPPPASPLPRNVRVLGLVSLLNDLASEAVYPLLPTFLLEVLGGSRTQLGLIEGAAESLASLLKLASGTWSDRLATRKPLVVAGYALATVTRPLLAWVVWPWQLLALRLVDRVGKGLRTAPRDALLADSVSAGERGRAFGFQRAMDHLGAACGPLCATAVLVGWTDNLRWLFLATLIPGVLVLVALVAGLREATRDQRSAPVDGGDVATPKSDETRISTAVRSQTEPHRRPFRWFLAAVLVFTLGNSSDAFLLVRVRELGVEPLWLPLLWVALHVVKSAGNLWAGRLVDRHGARPLLWSGWLVYAAAYLGFALASTAWQAVTLLMFYGLYYALTEPAEKQLVARLAGPTRQGQAYGWFHLTVGLGALPASWLCGTLYELWGPLAGLGSGAVLAVVASGLLLPVRLVAEVEQEDRGNRE